MAALTTERHESCRIDNQLRGRAGRQATPIPLLQDGLRIFGGERRRISRWAG